MKRGPYRVHPARLVLGDYGYTATALAVAAGMSPGGITRQLSGEVSMSARVRDALVRRVGEDGAAEVIAAIPAKEQAAA